MAVPAPAQLAISARAGLIHYVEGRSTIDGVRYQAHRNTYVNLKDGQTFATLRGRAEILLNPRSFLRLGDNSSFQLQNSDLVDTRIALLTGTAMVVVQDLDHDDAITVLFRDREIRIHSDGVYHFSLENGGRLRVFDGEAWVMKPGIATPFGSEPAVLRDDSNAEAKLKKGREVTLAAPAQVVAVREFNRKDLDALYKWSDRRDRAIERINNPPRRRARPRLFPGSINGF